MIQVVRFRLPDNHLSSLPHPSFAGRGLAERMRSTSFALFGLAAAAGLALVAIFAQPGGPLLSPAPLPSEPSSSVGKAEPVGAVGASPQLLRHPVALRGPLTGSSGSDLRGRHAGAAGGGSGAAHTVGKISAPHSVGPHPASGGGVA